MAIQATYAYPKNLRPFVRMELPHYPFVCDYGIVVNLDKLESRRPHLVSGTQLRPYKIVAVAHDPEQPFPMVMAQEHLPKTKKHIFHTVSNESMDAYWWMRDNKHKNLPTGSGGTY